MLSIQSYICSNTIIATYILKNNLLLNIERTEAGMTVCILTLNILLLNSVYVENRLPYETAGNPPPLGN